MSITKSVIPMLRPANIINLNFYQQALWKSKPLNVFAAEKKGQNMMAGEWAQKLTTERVIKHIQDGIKKAHKAFLAQQAILSMNKSHRRRRQIAKAYKLIYPMATINLTRKSH